MVRVYSDQPFLLFVLTRMGIGACSTPEWNQSVRIPKLVRRNYFHYQMNHNYPQNSNYWTAVTTIHWLVLFISYCYCSLNVVVSSSVSSPAAQVVSRTSPKASTSTHSSHIETFNQAMVQQRKSMLSIEGTFRSMERKLLSSSRTINLSNYHQSQGLPLYSF